MTTVYLDPAMVPTALRSGYDGKKFKAHVCMAMAIPSTAGLWEGGSRDTYRVVRLDDGAQVDAVRHNAAPWDGSRRDVPVNLQPGIAVIQHTIFCGKDMGLTFYVHPDNAAKLLPAPVELTAFEKIVLTASRNYKSNYGGMDRYQMAMRDVRSGDAFPTRDEWAIAKQTLINLGLLNKAGAITNAGRNAMPSRY